MSARAVFSDGKAILRATPATLAIVVARTVVEVDLAMRTRTRIHPYVTPALAGRLNAYCAAKGLTESAAVQAAIEQYLDGGERDGALILRRLDRQAQTCTRVQRDVEVLSEAFATYLRFWFGYLGERSEAEQKAAARLADRSFEEFVGLVATAMARQPRLASQVLKDDATAPLNQVRLGQPPRGDSR